jgi:tRNA pseudouridine55 synthase
VQRWFPRRTKIGHTGTLDPLATGVLVICVGAATRLADYVQAMPKSYASRFRLGATSSTDDADGDVVIHSDAVLPSSATVAAALAAFVGTIDQVPPAFSALKLQGKRAHELARKGEEVRLEARPVRIDAVRMIAYEWPLLDVEIDCGKGTYIRSIARDLGAALGCGAHLTALRRTRVGSFTLEDASTLEQHQQQPRVIPLGPSVAAAFPRHDVSAAEAEQLRHGRPIAASGLGGPVGVFDPEGHVLALVQDSGSIARPLVVLRPA